MSEMPFGGSRRSNLSAKFIGEPPDILDCIAALSPNEVPTPPWLANEMLNQLPEEVWTNKDLRWLDPSCKSGVFLREVARRLLWGVPENDLEGRRPTLGLTKVIPNDHSEPVLAVPEVRNKDGSLLREAVWELSVETRRTHIFKFMLWGLAITELMGDISRRSVYYTPAADSQWSVVRFEMPDGNIPFIEAKHDFHPKERGTCHICGAPASVERGTSRENYAYSFLHSRDLPEGFLMKFDVIIGNPPYHMTVPGSSDKAIYHHFILDAIKRLPRYILMITPSRWFVTGKGLDEFRPIMLADRRIRSITHFPDEKDCFPDNEIKGGVSYFLWSNTPIEEGPTKFIEKRGGKVVATSTRYLDAYDTFIRFNEAIEILEKIKRVEGISFLEAAGTLEEWCSSQTPFGLTTNFEGGREKKTPNDVPLHIVREKNRAVCYISRSETKRNANWIDEHKVLLPYAGDGSSSEPNWVTGKTLLAPGPSACTQTYLVAGRFKTVAEAENYEEFLRTKFVRYLLLLRKNTQHIKPSTFRFVPALDMSRSWTDRDLYKRYGLTEEEIGVVESRVKKMPSARPVVESVVAEAGGQTL